MRWNVVTAMLLLALNNITYAQIADVSGVGEDRDSALRDAKRNAVEQIVGTYINSETLVSQASVVSDEIYAKSFGFITLTKRERYYINGEDALVMNLQI